MAIDLGHFASNTGAGSLFGLKPDLRPEQPQAPQVINAMIDVELVKKNTQAIGTPQNAYSKAISPPDVATDKNQRIYDFRPRLLGIRERKPGSAFRGTMRDAVDSSTLYGLTSGPKSGLAPVVDALNGWSAGSKKDGRKRTRAELTESMQFMGVITTLDAKNVLQLGGTATVLNTGPLPIRAGQDVMGSAADPENPLVPDVAKVLKGDYPNKIPAWVLPMDEAWMGIEDANFLRQAILAEKKLPPVASSTIETYDAWKNMFPQSHSFVEKFKEFVIGVAKSTGSTASDSEILTQYLNGAASHTVSTLLQAFYIAHSAWKRNKIGRAFSDANPGEPLDLTLNFNAN